MNIHNWDSHRNVYPTRQPERRCYGGLGEREPNVILSLNVVPDKSAGSFVSEGTSATGRSNVIDVVHRTSDVIGTPATWRWIWGARRAGRRRILTIGLMQVSGWYVFQSDSVNAAEVEIFKTNANRESMPPRCPRPFTQDRSVTIIRGNEGTQGLVKGEGKPRRW